MVLSDNGCVIMRKSANNALHSVMSVTSVSLLWAMYPGCGCRTEVGSFAYDSAGCFFFTGSGFLKTNFVVLE